MRKFVQFFWFVFFLGLAVLSVGAIGYLYLTQQLANAKIQTRAVTNSYTTTQKTAYGTVTHTSYSPSTIMTLDVDTVQWLAQANWMIGVMGVGGALIELGFLGLLIGLTGRSKTTTSASQPATQFVPMPREQVRPVLMPREQVRPMRKLAPVSWVLFVLGVALLLIGGSGFLYLTEKWANANSQSRFMEAGGLLIALGVLGLLLGLPGRSRATRFQANDAPAPGDTPPKAAEMH